MNCAKLIWKSSTRAAFQISVLPKSSFSICSRLAMIECKKFKDSKNNQRRQNQLWAEWKKRAENN